MIREVDAGQAREMIGSNADLQLLDVREDWEYQKAHIEGVIHIPLGEVKDRFQELDSSKPVLCICAGGVRSYDAAQFLSSQGFETINLEGGTKGWIQQGLPVSKP